ncbi:hypothetical protein KCP73_12525 [Salmonella enterica subsp. enterica]|nr:hypothetical protein KCP73_12525 [Salmonella enterica subsp. enterica]
MLRHSLVGAVVCRNRKLRRRLYAAGLERGLSSPAVLPSLFEVRASRTC